MLLRWVYALKVKFNLTAPALHFQCAVPTLVLLAVSGFTQIGLGCGRPAALRCFVLGGACAFYAASFKDCFMSPISLSAL